MPATEEVPQTSPLEVRAKYHLTQQTQPQVDLLVCEEPKKAAQLDTFAHRPFRQHHYRHVEDCEYA